RHSDLPSLHPFPTRRSSDLVRVIGDVPIFVAHDSADVWSHRGLFKLDDNGYPTVVAGVPPDYFAPTGQLWGNPIYRWDMHQWSRDRKSTRLNSSHEWISYAV